MKTAETNPTGCGREGNNVLAATPEPKRVVCFLRLHPAGEPIRPHLLRSGTLAVGRLQLRVPRLASAANSTREMSLLLAISDPENNGRMSYSDRSG